MSLCLFIFYCFFLDGCFLEALTCDTGNLLFVLHFTGPYTCLSTQAFCTTSSNMFFPAHSPLTMTFHIFIILGHLHCHTSWMSRYTIRHSAHWKGFFSLQPHPNKVHPAWNNNAAIIPFSLALTFWADPYMSQDWSFLPPLSASVVELAFSSGLRVQNLSQVWRWGKGINCAQPCDHPFLISFDCVDWTILWRALHPFCS